MSLVIKSNLVITNPQLGKLLIKKIITSGSLIKSALGNIVGSSTDATLGGSPAVWSGAAVMEYVANGIGNSINASASTAYLNHPEIKDFEVSFDVAEYGDGELIVDLRRKLTGDNYCVRLKITTAGIAVASRGLSGSEVISIISKPISTGDKVVMSLIGKDIKLKVGSAVYTSVVGSENQDTLNRAGLFALSKGSTAAKTGRIVIKNLIVSELS